MLAVILKPVVGEEEVGIKFGMLACSFLISTRNNSLSSDILWPNFETVWLNSWSDIMSEHKNDLHTMYTAFGCKDLDHRASFLWNMLKITNQTDLCFALLNVCIMQLFVKCKWLVCNWFDSLIKFELCLTKKENQKDLHVPLATAVPTCNKIIEGFCAFWADFHFLQDLAYFWQMVLFCHEKHSSIIVFFVD